MQSYLRLLVLSLGASFAAAWLWVALLPMAFMEPEYPSWRAKQLMLDRCDPGEAIILGDSRAAAGILPNRLPFRAVNLAVGGGEPIEAVAMLRRVLTCPDHPRLAILSFAPGHFVRPDLFWERSVRYGLMRAPDIAELRRDADTSVYEWHHTDGLRSRLRDWLYEARFPPFYFSSLIHGGGLIRWQGNRSVLEATLAARGQYFFGKDAGSDAIAVDGYLESFAPLPVLDRYFDRLLTILDQSGIDAVFVAMPVNAATWQAVRPAVRSGFSAYLSAYERRYPRFHVDGELMPHWPNREFGDVYSHLNPAGAERFSAELAQRLQAAPPRTQNDAQNGWFSDTGTAASARVAPSSKRGS